MAPTNDHGGYWRWPRRRHLHLRRRRLLRLDGNIHSMHPSWAWRTRRPAGIGGRLRRRDLRLQRAVLRLMAPASQPADRGYGAVPGGPGTGSSPRRRHLLFRHSAGFYGSTGNISLVQPVVAWQSPGGNGYWLSAADAGSSLRPCKLLRLRRRPAERGGTSACCHGDRRGYLDITGSGGHQLRRRAAIRDLTTVLSSTAVTSSRSDDPGMNQLPSLSGSPVPRSTSSRREP